MKFQIKHKTTGKVTIEAEAESFKQVVENQGLNLYAANLQGADLQNANLQGADLQKANLQGAKLQEANLYRANLQGADLRGANLYEAKIKIIQRKQIIKSIGIEEIE